MEKKYSFDLNKLCLRLEEEGLLVETSKEVKKLSAFGMSYNSNTAEDGMLFICKGANFKEEYLKEAIKNGIICYIAEQKYENFGCEYIIVNDARKALAVSAEVYFGYDSKQPKICTLVGTKGKTTTVYFLMAMLKAAKETFAYSTTVEMSDGKNRLLSKLTTPESYELQSLIAAAKENGCKNMVMEVSSMAAKMHRTYAMSFEYGAYLNISPDHISKFEHANFEEYFFYKCATLKQCKNVAVNLDDEHVQAVIKEISGTANKIVTFSLTDKNADIYPISFIKHEDGKIVEIKTPKETLTINLKMPGDYNLSNALAAISCAYMMGLNSEAITEGFPDVYVPGRMEKLNYNGYTVIIDYAHNKKSMCAALTALSDDYPGKNIKVIFGCSGGKVPKRREDMAYESAQRAIYAYVTMDNPAFEDAMDIAKQIKNFLDSYGCKNEIILDRKQAVRTAIKCMSKDDIIFIAGKGREQFQRIKGKVEFYEGDVESAQEALKEYK